VPEGIVELNDTAGATLELLDGAREPETIAALLAEQFDAEPDELLLDVRALLADLAERGFIVL
jgi:coenzyme PQQ biosynthesis protein PqqD